MVLIFEKEVSNQRKCLEFAYQPEQALWYATNSSLRDRHFRDYKLGFEFAASCGV